MYYDEYRCYLHLADRHSITQKHIELRKNWWCITMHMCVRMHMSICNKIRIRMLQLYFSKYFNILIKNWINTTNVSWNFSDFMKRNLILQTNHFFSDFFLFFWFLKNKYVKNNTFCMTVRELDFFWSKHNSKYINFTFLFCVCLTLDRQILKTINFFFFFFAYFSFCMITLFIYIFSDVQRKKIM